MRTLVFDSTALVTLQRDRTQMLELLTAAREQGTSLRTTAPVLTEFVGGSPKRLRPAAEWVMSHFAVAGVDEVLARRGATLRQRVADAAPKASPSATDALVAAEAERVGAHLVITGDQADLEPLADASGSFTVIRLDELSAKD